MNILMKKKAVRYIRLDDANKNLQANGFIDVTTCRTACFILTSVMLLKCSCKRMKYGTAGLEVASS